MARGGLYKSDIQKARDALRAQGKHPSVDAVRVALGNTGSKTTIHRHLKELEEEEGQGPGAKVAVSEALQDLVGRLAGRLQEEADTVVTEARQGFEAQLQERSQALEHQRQEGAALSAQLQRTETALQAEKSEHTTTQTALADATMTIRQLEERIAGLTTRLAEHEAHARSLEEKHQHAREALEHYRTSVKEQRDQEQRRHEHQVQELQVALRQANEALTAKNHELLQLNRDNSQWLERHGRLERELTQTRQAAQAQQQQLDALRQTAVEHQALQARWAQDLQALEAAHTELTGARTDAAKERERREHAEAEALRAGVRLETLEQLLAQLRLQEDKPEPPERSTVPSRQTRKT
ncbi:MULTISPECIES: DNA-binding protein [Stenotrophomonas]|jgi:DNA repair exonuclease SbcCD ATPase subunit|uniref:DNA-binding protein n=1 Tax=Stenotrophomonas TaxID=40323 RepID=UPI000259C72B|nr:MULTISPECIES: DNA-binding protein [Stenotrophomonas]KMU64696.1 cointegrate resolution protein T [Stenotrophomonas maltophilia]CCH12672.1 cointegrate resolution protein T [Stenotrophomonas maltophilia D457]MBS3728722.1 Chromosome partition protein Smc [Stenotrophomonas sp. PE591]MCW8344057.1 DNA-binding protein [Stenotrophomonas sp. SG1]MDQ7271660.1 DNA-binding protein [Stenotrophomonas sp. Sm3212]